MVQVVTLSPNPGIDFFPEIYLRSLVAKRRKQRELPRAQSDSHSNLRSFYIKTVIPSEKWWCLIICGLLYILIRAWKSECHTPQSNKCTHISRKWETSAYIHTCIDAINKKKTKNKNKKQVIVLMSGVLAHEHAIHPHSHRSGQVTIKHPVLRI